MPTKPGLRAVKTGESAPEAPPQPPKTVAQAAKNGTPRELLVAMRDRVAETVSQSNCAARDLAALTKRLQEIAHDIDAIDARADEDSSARIRDLEVALRVLDPEHPLLLSGGFVDDSFDASAI